MKKQSKKPALVPVVFTYTDPLASSVYVAGSFNEWSPAVAALAQVAPGSWQLELSLPPGRHEYLFVVDGTWAADPLARESCPNPHGGVNAVIQL